ncbi:MAG TPA: ABC transporter permease [Acidobacteriaceae bacterium]|nr:ABC transporter permease [Acidobacteriaceae bacterium]
MSLWSRLANVFRGDRLNREITEEFESHIAEAVEKGRDPAEARRAFGFIVRQQEASHQVRVVRWLESLLADVIFGWRQLKRNKVTSAVAILSLGLAMGACVGAFRLIDALLWRPLPVAHAEQLYALSRGGMVFNGKPFTDRSWAHPSFDLMRAAVKDQTELIAVSDADRMDLTYRSDEEMEKANVQYVSGWMFDTFGLQPAVGRLLTANDELKPGAEPYAVLSYDYWTSRFGQDPKVVGRTLRMGRDIYEIVGVAPKPFTGTEPGIFTDIFLPTMMNPAVTRSDASWHRTLVVVKPGVPLEPLRQQLNAVSRAFEAERIKGFTGQDRKIFEQLLSQAQLLIEPASAGVSDLQEDYRRALGALGLLVVMVLLIACVNVANLMTAQAATRAREMALRVSIGAGKSRLVQMVLVESAMLAVIAAAIGALLAWRSAPFVVSMINPADNPARLVLPADWRVFGFGLALIFSVMLLFGLLPALRASSVKPASALRGGDDPHSRRRIMHAMIAAQVAFCFLVVFVSGLFVSTFEHLSNKPLGFSSDRLLLLESVAHEGQPSVVWEQIADNLRSVPGVEKVALAGWPLLGNNSWNGFILINGIPTGPTLAYFLPVSSGWVDTMKIRFIDGRDFRASDTSPGEAIVNETFVRTYFNRVNPIGKSFEKGGDHYTIVGLVADAPYRSLREPILPAAYVPFHQVDAAGVVQKSDQGTFIVRTASSNPLALASVLRQAIPHARTGFRVSNLRTQDELVRAQTVRERLLAILAAFFSGVALLLAAIGLYGVLNYSVLQREREFGIRIAVGARVGSIAWLATSRVFVMVLTGAVIGAALGMTSVRYVQTLLYEVKGSDPAMLVVPALMLLTAALLAAMPAVLRAVRIDPAIMLRAE